MSGRKRGEAGVVGHAQGYISLDSEREGRLKAGELVVIKRSGEKNFTVDLMVILSQSLMLIQFNTDVPMIFISSDEL